MTIDVTYKVHSSKWHILKALDNLSTYDTLSFDTETRGVYTKSERKEALLYLKGENLPVDKKGLALQIAANSGLSFPSLVSVTHFVFGISESESVIIVCHNTNLEILIWNWIANYKGLLLVHNSSFDLKIMYQRINKFPMNFEDTQLLSKCLTNNVNVWQCKVGLKDLMGVYYDPSWALFKDFEVDNFKDPKFLQYASIDGAATFKLWYDIQEYMYGEDNG